MEDALKEFDFGETGRGLVSMDGEPKYLESDFVGGLKNLPVQFRFR